MTAFFHTYNIYSSTLL